MRGILLIFVIVSVSYCQNQCPQIELFDNSCIFNVDCQAYTPYGYCRKFSGSYYGECASTLKTCPSGQSCYKESVYDWNCRVPSGGACTSDSQCRLFNKCKSGICKCPTEVRDFGLDSCYWMNDALSGSVGATVCANTNRTCYRINDNPLYVIGKCGTPVGGLCDTDNDCVDSSPVVCHECKCRRKSDITGCIPYTPLMNILNEYNNCIRIYTVASSNSNADLWCSVAAENCKYLLAGATYDNNNNLGNYVQTQINSNSVDSNRMKFCDFVTYVSNYCGFNAFSTSMTL